MGDFNAEISEPNSPTFKSIIPKKDRGNTKKKKENL